MIEKLFIRNWQNTEDKEVRNSYGKAAGVMGIITNLVLGALKLFIGVISNSVSVMADAVNNITDMASSALTIVGFKLSGKKPNAKHPYGYARYEYLSAFIISLFMLVMGCVFVKESISKMLNPSELQIDKITYIVLGIAVLGKLFQLLVYRRFAKAINSQTLEASALDTRNDIITSVGILASMVIMGYFKVNIDAYVGLAVSVLVVISSLGALKESVAPIIGIPPTEERVKMISEKLLSYQYVLGIHDLMMHNYGVNNDIVTVHVELDSKLDLLVAHELMDKIESDFRTEYGIMLTIHMDPLVLEDKELESIKQQIGKSLAELNPAIMFHDVRMVRGKNVSNVIFDCVVPFESNYDKAFFADYLSERVTGSTKLNFVVEVEYSYC